MGTGGVGLTYPSVTFSVMMGKEHDPGSVTTLCQNMAANLALETVEKKSYARSKDVTLVSSWLLFSVIRQRE